MPNKTINLRKIKKELRGGLAPERELSAPPEEKLLMTEEQAHLRGFGGTHLAGVEKGDGAKIYFNWRAPEFDYSFDKGLNLLFFGVVLIIGGIVTAFFKNFTFAALLILSGALVVSYAFKLPREVNLAATSRGIKVGNRLYLFEDLKSFWIHYDPPFAKELILESRKAFVPHIRAPLGDVEPLRLREILLRFLKEDKHEDSLSDTISKTIGF